MLSPWLQVVLGLCALAITVLQLAGKFGWWAGRESVSLETVAAEILTLRAWRHKIGDEPCDAVGKLLDIYDRRMDARVTKLENKVFNGAAR